MRAIGSLLLCASLSLVAACVPRSIEVKPVHMTVDVTIHDDAEPAGASAPADPADPGKSE